MAGIAAIVAQRGLCGQPRDPGVEEPRSNESADQVIE